MIAPRLSTFFSRLHKYTDVSWPGWATVLIHGSGFLGLTFMTLYDFFPLLYSYRERNVAIEINIMSPRRNDSIPRPSVTWCIPYYSGAIPNLVRWLEEEEDETEFASLEREAMANHSWDLWTTDGWWNSTTTLERASAIRSKLIIDLVTKVIVEKRFDALKLDGRNLNWNQPIVDAVWRFLACMADMDTSYLIDERPILDECTQIAARISNLDGARDVFDRFYEYMIESLAMYSNVGYRSSQADVTSTKSTIRGRRVYMYEDYSCFELRRDVADESFLFWGYDPPDPGPKPWQRFRRTRAYTIFPSNAVLYSSIGGSLSLYHTSTDHLKLKAPDQLINSERVYLTYQVESMIVEKRPEKLRTCVRETSLEECTIKRQIRAAAQFCGCRPFTYRFVAADDDQQNAVDGGTDRSIDSPPRSLPYCTQKMYATCANRLITNLAHVHDRECAEKCEYVTYRWQSSETIEHDPIRRDRLYYVQLTRGPTEMYTEFSRVVRDPPEKFASQVGGLVNLYLGLSGLSLCAFLTFCIRSYDRYKTMNGGGQKVGCSNSNGGGGSSTEGGFGEWKDIRLESLKKMAERRRRSDSDTGFVGVEMRGCQCSGKAEG